MNSLWVDRSCQVPWMADEFSGDVPVRQKSVAIGRRARVHSWYGATQCLRRIALLSRSLPLPCAGATRDRSIAFRCLWRVVRRCRMGPVTPPPQLVISSRDTAMSAAITGFLFAHASISTRPSDSTREGCATIVADASKSRFSASTNGGRLRSLGQFFPAAAMKSSKVERLGPVITSHAFDPRAHASFMASTSVCDPLSNAFIPRCRTTGPSTLWRCRRKSGLPPTEERRSIPNGVIASLC